MREINDGIIRIGLNALYFSGVHHLMAPRTAGLGVIFMLHRVRPAPRPDSFAPNRGLEVTPEFLDGVLTRLRRRGIEIIDMDAVAERIQCATGPRFAAFTFDDGYADNLDVALPVFEAHGAPFTIYIATGMIEGTADVWWLTLEETIGRLDAVRAIIGGRHFNVPARNVAEKQAAWDAIYWPLRDLSVAERRVSVAALAEMAGIAQRSCFEGLVPSWEQLRRAAQHRLVRFGAHTIDHFPLTTLSTDDARREIAEGRRLLEEKLDREVTHFAYPFGDAGSAGPREFALARDSGFSTAVTTRRGVLFPDHNAHLHALPRVSLNGGYQAIRYVDLFLSGAPFAVLNRGQRLNVASGGRVG